MNPPGQTPFPGVSPHRAAYPLWAWPIRTAGQPESRSHSGCANSNQGSTKEEDTHSPHKGHCGALGAGEQGDCASGHTGHLLQKDTWLRLGDIADLFNS